jgi:DNA invertase Pin-like site-specific DNA recombinase
MSRIFYYIQAQGVVVWTQLPTSSFPSYTYPIRPILMEIGLKCRKTGELSALQRSAIIFGYKNGISWSKLANEFGCSRRTFYNTLNDSKSTN